VVSWHEGRVSSRASVELTGQLTGDKLRDAYVETIRTFTFGLARLQDNSVHVGPIELLRFGAPNVTSNAVEWPIEGGLLSRGAGGRWRIQSSPGHVEATMGDFRPLLPRPVYLFTHLPVHQLFTRIFLLRLRGVEPRVGRPAPREDRLRAAAVDVAFCLTLAGFTGRRRTGRTLAITLAYHVACWSVSGRTLGGLVMRQRVVALDGSRLTPAQALMRFAVLPLGWITRRPVHDEIACTVVVND
jgi:hypothetical protein